MSELRSGSVAATVGRELLPEFALIGAMKSGTSSLHLYRSDHPHHLHAVAEGDPVLQRGEELPPERRLVPAVLRPGLRPGARVFGDATPGYFHHPHALERMKAVIPHARLILLLRDPVKRFLKAWVPAPACMNARLRLRRANHRRFVYPPIDPALDAALRSNYEDADLKLSRRVGPLPWRRADGAQP